jgi:hypothetical protein
VNGNIRKKQLLILSCSCQFEMFCPWTCYICESDDAILLRNDWFVWFMPGRYSRFSLKLAKKIEREIHKLLDGIKLQFELQTFRYQRCAIWAKLWAILLQFLPVFTFLLLGDYSLSRAILLYTLHFLDILNVAFLKATGTVGQDANLVQVHVYPKLVPCFDSVCFSFLSVPAVFNSDARCYKSHSMPVESHQTYCCMKSNL